MEPNNWPDELPGAVIVCDKQGLILYLNNKACQTYEREGGAKLVGKSVLDCHPELAKAKLVQLLKNQTLNCYTIEKKGIKKIIYQSPWYEKGKFKGLVELSLPIPLAMPHFIRRK
jgi:transcriptional regulator with PAS, ATPase and Fis domain